MFSNVPPATFLVVGSRIFPLDQKVVNVGRGLNNDLIINHPSVSRQHARLNAKRGHFSITDLNSTSGTRVNGQRIKNSELTSGDMIALADVVLLYVENYPEILTRSMEITRQFNEYDFG